MMHSSERDISPLLDVLGCALEDRSAWYAAVPISSGSRFNQWYGSVGRTLSHDPIAYQKEHYTGVVVPNCIEAQKRIARIRLSTTAVLIDPTRLDWPDWTQEAYRSLWEAVVRRFVHTAVFLDGWQYSSGCVFEFGICLEYGIRRVSENLNELINSDALELIRSARDELSVLNLPFQFHDAVLQRVNSAGSMKAQYTE